MTGPIVNSAFTVPELHERLAKSIVAHAKRADACVAAL